VVDPVDGGRDRDVAEQRIPDLAGVFKPHLVQTSKLSTDPQFIGPPVLEGFAAPLQPTT
jgi:hypothetical protein